MPPKKKADSKAEAIFKLTAMAKDESLPLDVRETSAKALVDLLAVKPEPEKSEPAPAEDRSWRITWAAPTAAERQADKARELHRAAAKADSGHCERIVAYWTSTWPDVPVPLFEMAPLPTPTLEERVQLAERELQEQREDYHAALLWHMDDAARGAALTTGRSSIAQDRKDHFQGDWHFSEW